MNCDRCPHLAQIEAALKPCQTCEAGSLHGTVHFDAAPCAQTIWALTLPNDHTPSAGVTELDPEAEDALRKMLFVIFDLSPLHLLLLQNFMHRRSPVALRETLVELRQRLMNKYGLDDADTGVFRSVAGTWKDQILEKLPVLRPMFAAIIDEAKCK